MINVNSVYEKIQALSLKNSSGYHSNSDFNQQQRLVQDTLFEWYFSVFEATQRIPEALAPFIKEPSIPISDGRIPYPSDYRHRIEVSVAWADGKNITWHRCPYQPAKEVAEYADSFIRRPRKEKRLFYHTFSSLGIDILPKDHIGAARLKYLSTPPDAIRNVTVDTVNIVENYNPTGSVNFAWPSQEESNIVDIFLYFKGIQTRTSELLAWVSQKNQLTKQ